VERREASRQAIVAAARQLFGGQGFAATTVDQVAAAANLAKGAVYHHFPGKEALFEAVFEAACADVVGQVRVVAAQTQDILEAMAAGAAAYFDACSEGEFRRIILQDGPAVLGWERWRQIDAEHFGRMAPAVLATAMEQGLIARQPVEPLARLLLGAMTEAAAACAASEAPRLTGAEHVAAFRTILEGLRVRDGKAGV
jgi:AcrR family transcriptional regulator